MKKVRILIVSFALALFTIIPGFVSPASASHNCSLQDVDPTIDALCDSYHDPKAVISIIICLIKPTC